MASYRFEAVVEPDDDQWHAYCPALLDQGGATWGETREQALANLEEVVRLVVASMREHGDRVPAGVAERDYEKVISISV